MISHALTTFAILALAASAPGQSIQPTTSPTHITYTMGEGYEIVYQAQRSGPETIFNNRQGSSLYFSTLNTSTSEYVDEGSFPRTGVSWTEQVNGMTFDYCSTLPSPTGAGVDVELRFYEETIGGQGITGWSATARNELCGYLIAGLPGDTSGTGISCWTVGLNLSGGFECTLPQEQFVGSMNTWGWSTMYFDALSLGGSGGFINGTGGYGVQDYLEWYDWSAPLGSIYQGSINFGGGPNAQANFWMSLEGNPTDTLAYYSTNPGSADSIDLQGDVEVRANQTASWNITNPTPGSSYALLASTGSADLPALAGGQAHLLVNWLGAPLLPAPVVMPGGVYSQMMPAALPPSLYAQAAEYSGALHPSNVTAMSNGLSHSN